MAYRNADHQRRHPIYPSVNGMIRPILRKALLQGARDACTRIEPGVTFTAMELYEVCFSDGTFGRYNLLIGSIPRPVWCCSSMRRSHNSPASSHGDTISIARPTSRVARSMLVSGARNRSEAIGIAVCRERYVLHAKKRCNSSSGRQRAFPAFCQIKRDVDDHILLTADHLATPQFDKDRASVQAIFGRRLLRM